MSHEPPSTRYTGLLDRTPAGEETIPVDVEEHDDEFVVIADLPGFKKQNIDVTVRKNRVRIAAERPMDDERGQFLRRERHRGRVSRLVHLPEWVDDKRTSAEYVNGQLRIHLKKRRHPHRVEVE